MTFMPSISRALMVPALRVLALVGLIAAQTTAAFETRVLPVQAVAPAPAAEWVAPSADGGHWAVVRHRDNIVSVDRYRANGSLLARQFEAEVSEVGGGTWATLQLQELPDGSAVGYNRRCRLVRFNADGSLRWVSSEEPGEQPCINLQPSVSGAFWLSFRDDGGPETGLRRRDASGRDRGRRDQGLDEFEAFPMSSHWPAANLHPSVVRSTRVSHPQAVSSGSMRSVRPNGHGAQATAITRS